VENYYFHFKNCGWETGNVCARTGDVNPHRECRDGVCATLNACGLNADCASCSIGPGSVFPRTILAAALGPVAGFPVNGIRSFVGVETQITVSAGGLSGVPAVTTDNPGITVLDVVPAGTDESGSPIYTIRIRTNPDTTEARPTTLTLTSDGQRVTRILDVVRFGTHWLLREFAKRRFGIPVHLSGDWNMCVFDQISTPPSGPLPEPCLPPSPTANAGLLLISDRVAAGIERMHRGAYLDAGLQIALFHPDVYRANSGCEPAAVGCTRPGENIGRVKADAARDVALASTVVHESVHVLHFRTYASDPTFTGEYAQKIPTSDFPASISDFGRPAPTNACPNYLPLADSTHWKDGRTGPAHCGIGRAYGASVFVEDPPVFVQNVYFDAFNEFRNSDDLSSDNSRDIGNRYEAKCLVLKRHGFIGDGQACPR